MKTRLLPTSRTMRGFTLAELLVSTVVFAIVMAAAIGLLITQRRTLEAGELARGSLETGRHALLTVERALRLAGFGVDPRFAFDFTSFRCTEADRISGAGGRRACRDRRDAPDRLTFVARDPHYRIDPNGTNGCTRLQGCPVGSAWELVSRDPAIDRLTVDARAGDVFEAGRTLLVACAGGARHTMVTVNTTRTAADAGPLQLDLRPTAANNPYVANELELPCLDLGGFVFRLDRYHFEIRRFDGVPWLVLDPGLDLDGDGNDPWTAPDDDDLLPIAPDVDDLQVAYVLEEVNGQNGPDSNGNWVTGDDPGVGVEEPDPAAAAPQYQTPPDHPARRTLHPANVRAVRVSLVVRGARPDPAENPAWEGAPFPVIENGTGTPPAAGLERRQRHRVATSVAVRNLASRGMFTF